MQIGRLRIVDLILHGRSGGSQDAGIDLMDGGAERGNHRRSGLRRSNHQDKKISRTLIERKIQDRLVRRIEAAFFDIVHDADDFYRLGGSGEAGDLFPDRVFAREELFGERAINDRHAGLGGIFVFRKVTAAQELRADGCEVGGAHIAFGRVVMLAVPGPP